jgi:hypothetical protein
MKPEGQLGVENELGLICHNDRLLLEPQMKTCDSSSTFAPCPYHCDNGAPIVSHREVRRHQAAASRNPCDIPPLAHVCHERPSFPTPGTIPALCVGQRSPTGKEAWTPDVNDSAIERPKGVARHFPKDSFSTSESFYPARATEHYRHASPLRKLTALLRKGDQPMKRIPFATLLSASSLLLLSAAGTLFAADQEVTQFSLTPNPQFVDCLAAYPQNPSRPPTADVTVVRGKQNDVMVLKLKNIKPGLAFDLFTVQRSNLLASGAPDPDFANKFNKSFSLAWYQSDIETKPVGRSVTTIKTIVLDQSFGFDPDVKLPPTNTFHVGFWFNDPKAAAACGFDVTKPTPFNGEHQAGPLAMISLPDADTGLGPLCTKPDTSTIPPHCNP